MMFTAGRNAVEGSNLTPSRRCSNSNLISNSYQKFGLNKEFIFLIDFDQFS